MTLQTIENRACVAFGVMDVRNVEQSLDYNPDEQVLVRVSRGGICGSDIHYYQHARAGMSIIKNPLVLGHEFIGVVQAAPPGSALRSGQRIAVNPSRPCNQCPLCLEGKQNLCRSMKFMGSAQFNPHVNGGFAEYVAVTPAQCVPYAEHAEDRVMVFAEPLAVAIHAVHKAGDLLGKRVLVTGSGPIGCLVMAAALEAGASEVIATDMNERCRALAVQMGARAAFSPMDEVATTAWAENGGAFDVVFEASGAPSAIASTATFTRPGGTVVQVGMGSPNAELPLGQLLVKEITLVGSFRFINEFETSVRWLESGRVDPRPLISAEFEQGSVVEALEMAGDKNLAAKVQLVFG